ncbi:lysine--tRNA ligase [Candidatus Woesearchaeota archaeon]|nr:lysine--tRNA ligase [Candidatus Woesearchaeota archaeon]
MKPEDLLVKERIEKLNQIKKLGVNPYPSQFKKKDNISGIIKNFSKLKNEEYSKAKIKTAGKILAIREMGKASFVDIQDQDAKIQCFFREDEIKEKYNLYKLLDIGDIIGVEGSPFRTKRGELSILIKDLLILTKSLKPLPDKWHGLKDTEERLRKRYLDILTNPEVKEMFIKKAKFWNTIRSFLMNKGFLEVETPILENSTGGAAATPFKTHHNTLDIDVFLRISCGELWQKKLLVSGFEKIFEIGRIFRNEGMDSEHLQDYSQMEFYWAYADFKDGMELVQEMYKLIAKEVLGSLKFKTRCFDVDLGKKWELYDYEKLIKEKTSINIYKTNAADIRKKLDFLKMEYEKKADKWRLIDLLWKYCRKSLAGPGFLINQPVEISPLAKRQEKNNKKVEQFQVIIAGTELGNGYSELNDPLDQEKRFQEQKKLKETGDKEAHEFDETFVEALKYGMPPACGFGVSERFFAYLMDKPVRECVIFPLMKPEKP